jgi:ADP-ribose pyrophosphatase YjhB (NUDIX family)
MLNEKWNLGLKNVSITKQHKHQDVCNNCAKIGHLFRHCKSPITSFGVVQFRINGLTLEREYLMIRRKQTLGYIDFLRGKYSTSDKQYIINMMIQMTDEEKDKLLNLDFDTLWCGLWENNDSQLYKVEEENSRSKFQYLKYKTINPTTLNTKSKQKNSITYFSSTEYSNNDISELASLINESNEYQTWSEPEWGFPKGRRNYLEKDYQCALREMTEETGYTIHDMINIKNLLPFEEVFIGSNYKTYKHKYYLMYMKYKDTLINNNFDDAEISLMVWKSYQECMESIRPYNSEKKVLITRIENTLINSWT